MTDPNDKDNIMTKLNNLSDRDLNRGIASKLGYWTKNVYRDEIRIRVNGLHTVDYCNDWNDLYPLILKYKIERHISARFKSRTG